MAILFSFFLIYDTQQIMGGKKYSISPEEHIFAAIQVSSPRLLNLQPQR
jgi:FtsH-binding integral membrane protein